MFDYEDFLLMTSSKTFFEKKETGLGLKSVSEELRFKIESSLVLFFLKELKYQREIEKLRLNLFNGFQFNILELYEFIDTEDQGFIDYEQMKAFIESRGLEFESFYWDNLLFRLKKKTSNNPKAEKIMFIEFHDLLYPVTFFEVLSQKEYLKWLNYLDTGERFDEVEAEISYMKTPRPTPNSHRKVKGKDTHEFDSTPSKLKVREYQDHVPTELKKNLNPQQLFELEETKKKIVKRGGNSFEGGQEEEENFFGSLYRVKEVDESFKMMGHLTYKKENILSESPSSISERKHIELMHSGRKPKPTPKENRTPRTPFRSQNPADTSIDQSFYEDGMNIPWLHYNKHYEIEGFKGSKLLSKYTRYIQTLKDAANDMYG